MKIGLVLAGGGGKGAYQMGVLKAMEQVGLTPLIQAVSGTSVGALNGALLLNNKIAQTCTIWETIAPSKILSIKGQPLVNQLKGTSFESLYVPLSTYSKKLQDYGIFSRSGMVKLIEEAVDLQQISASPIPFYATCVAFPYMKKTYFQLNGLTPEEIQSILLATSAIPIVFPPEKIDNVLYFDGGLADNVPIAPLYEQGCDVIIVVPLDRSYTVNRSLYPNAKIYEIVPQKSLGHVLSGTMQFNQEVAKQRIHDGFNDAMSILDPLISIVTNEKTIYTSMHKIKQNEQLFQSQHANNIQRFEQTLTSLQQKIQGVSRK